jgi:prepilin-type N-terminal cleavage/methylation domain-containing protein
VKTARSRCRGCRGFTLLEVLVATSLAAGLLSAVVSVYAHAMRLRERTTAAAEESALERRALTMLRRDLRNAAVGEGRLIGLLQGSPNAAAGGYPGTLTFTTTSARLLDDDETGADVQQVVYAVEAGTRADGSRDPEGVLVRSVERVLLAPDASIDLPRQPLLTGVSEMEVAFYDGQQWLDEWDSNLYTGAAPTAVHVRLLRDDTTDPERNRPPLELVVAWTMNPVPPESADAGAPPAGAGGQP